MVFVESLKPVEMYFYINWPHRVTKKLHGGFGRLAIFVNISFRFRNKDCTFRKKYKRRSYGKRYTYRNYYQYHNGHKTVGHYDEYHCHYKCGYGIYHAAGRCAGYGLCLCWWGWTGTGAQYLDEGEYAGRVVAYYCTKPCTYGPFYKNPACGYIPKKHDSVAHDSTTKRD